MQKNISQYLHFTKRERTGIIVLLSLSVIILFIPSAIDYFFPPDPILSHLVKIEMEKTPLKETVKSYSHHYSDSPYPHKISAELSPAQLFYFDPNTVSDEGWTRLGVDKKTISTIRKYLSRGGKFVEPGDLEKLWGLKDGLKKALIPFVQISAKEKIPAIQFSKKQVEKIFINDADSAEWERLPGIGPKLAQRIIRFRERLGGFYSLSQVGETFGLPDSVFQRIRVYLLEGKKEITYININSVTVNEMKTHPYFRFALANAVIQYRDQHGRFKQISDIKKIMIVTDTLYSKISPYLVVE